MDDGSDSPLYRREKTVKGKKKQRQREDKELGCTAQWRDEDTEPTSGVKGEMF